MGDGGPAFPVFADGNVRNVTTSLLNEGMTLRDWFAGQALQAGVITSSSPDNMAKVAYQIADAMLKTREAS